MTDRPKIIPAQIKRDYIAAQNVNVVRLKHGIGYQQCVQILAHQGIEVVPRQQSNQKRRARRARLPQDETLPTAPTGNRGQAQIEKSDAYQERKQRKAIELAARTGDKAALQELERKYRIRYPLPGEITLSAAGTVLGSKVR